MTENKNRYRIGKTYVSITNPIDTTCKIREAVSLHTNEYICISNVRTVNYANKNKDYRNVLNNSYLTTADGMPLIWAARLWGIKTARRTMGPELFVNMLSDKQSEIKHFLLGDTQATLSKLKTKYYEANIVGTYSPPFCELDGYNFEEIANYINESGGEVVWVSLRSPKQDFFSVKILPYLNGKVVIGVGAAFRYALGEYRQPNKLVQKLGLTGLFWRKINLGFLIYYFQLVFNYLPRLIGIVIYRLLGKKCYEQ